MKKKKIIRRIVREELDKMLKEGLKIGENTIYIRPNEIDMQGNVIKNLGAPVNDNDAAPYYIAKKTETIVVAAYNSLRKFKADYVCDGVDDQEEINSAISEIARLKSDQDGIERTARALR